MKRLVMLAALAISLSAAAQPGAHAQMRSPYAPAYPPAQTAPHELIQRGIDRLTGFLIGAQDPSPQALRGFLDREIAPNFDFAYMARWAAGPMHRRLSAEQRARMAAMLRDLFLGALARNLGTYNRPLPRVDVFPARFAANGEQANVHARVLADNGLLVRLNFRFYWSPQGWRIFDVSANGASAVGFYRSYFTELFTRYGPDAVLQ